MGQEPQQDRVQEANDLADLAALIGRLFEIVRALNKLFPGRPFTPDGHLVGSIGEVVAAHTYGLCLEAASQECFDAKTEADQTVQIKLTSGDRVSVSSDSNTPDLLLVLKLDPKTGFKEIYNGKFPLELWRSKKASKRRVVSLGLRELAARNPRLLEQKHPLTQINSHFGGINAA